MKPTGLIVAGALLIFVLSDIWYVVREWAEFRPHDVTRHVQFQVFSLLAVAWYFGLVKRAWRMNWQIHAKLALSFSILIALTVIYSLLWPAFEHGTDIEGVSPLYGRVFVGILLTLGMATVWWSWQVSTPNPSFQGTGADAPPPEL